MNGVRRFLAGGGTPPTAQQFPVSPSTPPPGPTLESPFQSPAPLAVPPKPTWPPSPVQSPTDSSPPDPVDSPKTTTAGLFFRKDRQRPLPTASTFDEGVVGNGSFHSPQSSRESNGISPPRSNGSSGQLSSPGAGPSSPRPLPTRVSELSRKPVAMELRPTSMVYNARDDLLISLLASEAIVDSRGCEILSAEEVEELKKEHQVLSSRLAAMTKKLALETKIRDAALSLSKANASYKNVSKQSSEHLETANRKVEQAQKDLWRVSERANEIQRKLFEHRAGVLSYSVRSLEKKAAPQDGDSSASGYSSPSRSAQMSPTPSSVTSMTTVSSRGRFEHFFAGHSDSVTPTTPRLPPTMAEVTALEDKLRAATAALEAATAKQGEMVRELSHLRLEKEQIETTLGMDLQSAEETIATLEQSAGRAEGVDVRLQELEAERAVWRRDHAELEERRREVDTLERRLEVLEEQSGEVAEMETAFAREREEIRGMLAAREKKMEETQRQMADMKLQWDIERSSWEAEKATLQDGAQSKMELAQYSDALRDLMHAHGIVLTSRDVSLMGLVQSVGRHIEDMHSKAEAHARAEDEWVALRTKLEMDVRAGLDKREALFEEVEEARRTRDEARMQARDFETQLREQSMAQMAVVSLQGPQGPVDFATDAASIVALLQPMWAVLPSPEARANKLGARNVRPGPPSSPVLASRSNASLSDMDVRSLKTLYDPRGTSAQPSGAFTVEGFVTRVQALIADDRALIERLLRFAQAHDLLKKNAERAQKLAQESSNALETYQKQVNMLEERNLTMMAKQQALDEEVQQLHETIEQITAEKLEIEMQAAEQAETCRQLTDANNALSARMLALAEESASAGGSVNVSKQLETQLAECNASLARAKDEIESMRSSQQMQQMALLEELNNVQTENSTLREQLRKR
ncbi:Up-regulated during septation-domain-containing protein [Fomitopsis serialis]|uniref:Up-regulated during septation-domain-containing protein n=1 Tax=Fomitopsis serialis TaxID=139415 RepID=UPI002008B0B5|nr:Up-regulated during septation-domain-containing protein [Neoantrodia serialis]KAH9912391.1 Up-regulated during septation-domain-containing protein [Neoantrodia serialis]